MNTSLSTLREFKVGIPCSGAILRGDVAIPAGAEALVIFAHGSGSSRLSPRNRLIAGELHRKGIGTLLFDLLTQEEAVDEARSGELRLNIPMRTHRLLMATAWCRQEDGLKDMTLGYFGTSTGAAAALAAATQTKEIRAVVARGARTDLAGDRLERITSPTLLIVGELDLPLLQLNREAYHTLQCVKHLAIVSGATHLFQEPDALEHVAELAANWFELHLIQSPTPTNPKS